MSLSGVVDNQPRLVLDIIRHVTRKFRVLTQQLLYST
jgi:hypothetical protein